jgi:hypothetical protein
VANINGTALSVSGNITGANSNIATQTGTTLSVTGNVTGGNLITSGTVNAATHTGTLVSVTGNITGGNITTAGIGSFTGSYMVVPTNLNNAIEASVTTVGALYYNTSNAVLRIRGTSSWTNVNMAQPIWITPAGTLGTIPEGIFYQQFMSATVDPVLTVTCTATSAATNRITCATALQACMLNLMCSFLALCSVASAQGLDTM